jgi:hypothetical protein
MYFIALTYRFSRAMLVSLTKKTANTNPIINKTNPVMLYLSDIMVVVMPLFVSAAHKKRIKIIVMASMMVYFFSGNSFQKSCSLID